jgi:hypothetical protein
MLIISFGTRTDSTSDPLVERALDLTFEFMELTGMHFHVLFRPIMTRC